MLNVGAQLYLCDVLTNFSFSVNAHRKRTPGHDDTESSYTTVCALARHRADGSNDSCESVSLFGSSQFIAVNR